MLKQLHPVTAKVHDWPGLQKPLHSGELASPHAVVLHWQAPAEVAAEQCPPLPQVPSHRRVSELKSHGPGGSVVVVVPPTSAPRVAGAHRNCAALNRTTRIPLSWSVIWAAAGNGFGQSSL